MSATTIDIKDNATPALQSLMANLAGERINPVAGRAGVNCLKAHFRQLEVDRPNKLGGKRTHFYAQAARGTFYTLLPDGVMLGVNQVGIRQRFKGGPIEPSNPPKYLTIPACAEAYGHRAREFSLRFNMNPKTGKKWLSDIDTGKPMFWLVPGVNQQADSTVLPADAVLSDYIAGEITGYLMSKGGLT
jgi:hypothetical protein